MVLPPDRRPTTGWDIGQLPREPRPVRARPRRPRAGVRAVALVATLILVGHGQIIHGTPELALSENATQILIASVSGLTAVLGGYMGYRLRGRHHNDD